MHARFVIALCLSLVLMGESVSAQDSERYAPLANKYQIYLGGFFPSIDSTVRINGEILPPGPGLNFEDVFGLEDSDTLLWGGARWRISQRNMLEFEFVKLDRDGSITGITDPIEIGDTIVQVGARVDTTFDVTVARLTYGFSLARNERMDIQLKAGVHLADVATTLQLSGAVCEVTDPNDPTCVGGATPIQEEEDITVPLPHFGGSFIYGLTPSVVMRLQIIGFAIELDKIDGSLVELDADLIWQPWDHFSLGAGVRYFDADIEGKGGELNGEFEFEYFGPVVYGMLNF